MMVQKRIRSSNIELLRIVAMILIMFGHSHLRIHHASTFIDVLLSCITTTGVGVFIAISGWFGIHFRLQGLAKYLYQVFFTLWMVYALAIAFGVAKINIDGIMISLSFYEGYWFVIGYLGLYLISPILNSFIEHARKIECQILLLSYFLFQCYYSWLSAWYDYYNGYSIVLFGGIYLTVAYIRKYPVQWIQKNAVMLLVGVLFFMSVIAYFSLLNFGHAARQIRDDNPLVILVSILMVICFSKMKFQSKVINWLAASCFAVYLIHYSPFVCPYFMQLIRDVYAQFDGLIYGFTLLFALVMVYVLCTLFDQLRIVSWALLQKIVGNNK